jgi:hypothetical protein
LPNPFEKCDGGESEADAKDASYFEKFKRFVGIKEKQEEEKKEELF